MVTISVVVVSNAIRVTDLILGAIVANAFNIFGRLSVLEGILYNEKEGPLISLSNAHRPHASGLSYREITRPWVFPVNSTLLFAILRPNSVQ